MQPLDFRLPPFLRCSWTSSRARELWLGRMQAAAAAWRHALWTSVRDGVRPACLLPAVRTPWPVPHPLPAPRDGLVVSALAGADRDDSTPASPEPLVVGLPAAAAALSDAWRAADHLAVAAMLDIPACCATAYQTRVIDAGLTDPTSVVAEETARRGGADSESGVVTVRRTDPTTSTLLRRLGLRAVPHSPCAFVCNPSRERGAQLLATARALGYEQEAAWLEEILSWPVEWSALHGIAEIKTPVVRAITDTDATSGKQVVAWHGPRYPEAGARGAAFPYRREPRATLLQISRRPG